MKTSKDKMSVTVGIPTCYGGQSLVETVKSLRATQGGRDVTIIVTADRTPLSFEVKKQLKALDVELHWNTVSGSQFKKIKQMVKRAQSDIYISTQDDITFDGEILNNVRSAFAQDPQLTMIGARVLPLVSRTTVEGALAAMIRLIDRVSGTWRNGVNYLAANGRFLAFRTDHIKKLRFPEAVVNGDMFIYLENKRLGGTFAQLKNGKVYIRPPQRLQDQIGPSSRFQFSQSEMRMYFGVGVAREYELPIRSLFRATIEQLVRRPSSTLLYVLIFLYSRLRRLPLSTVSNPLWTVDVTTKETK